MTSAQPAAVARIEDFVRDLQSARTLEAICTLLSAAARALSFDHFALTQRFGARIDGAPVQITDYPADWVSLLRGGSFWMNDPVIRACQTAIAPFAWNDLGSLLELSPRQASYMRVAAREGLANGWTIPIQSPGEAPALCSFVVSSDRELPRESLPAAHYLASFAFQSARRLASRRTPPMPRLTRRQIDCVILAARGKSDWVAGQILGLAPDTVHKYLEQAKARVGVSSRTELVVRALHDGQISFSDLID